MEYGHFPAVSHDRHIVHDRSQTKEKSRDPWTRPYHPPPRQKTRQTEEPHPPDPRGSDEQKEKVTEDPEHEASPKEDQHEALCFLSVLCPASSCGQTGGL